MQISFKKIPLIITALATCAVSSALTLAVTSAAPPTAAALNFIRVSFAPIGDAKPTPYGWRLFCQAQPEECRGPQLSPTFVRLTSQSWAELNQINGIVNREIEPLGDEDHYKIYEQDILNWWTYPDDGKGNCNDYVIMKRKLLVEAGWPKSALLMTVVVDQHGDGHLILMVRTDHGDLILDNMREQIVPWDRTGYRFVKRQSQFNYNDWVAIDLQAEPKLVATADRR
ncbi:MAG TPA: transglutaminase-like cysteine peptidase [Xanthobacteraceae bacterium]|nr:transglutaminase-like cysteine peptidase [Xanthobacteraceae bacterium]